MSDFVLRLLGEDKTKEATDSAKSNIEALGGVADKVKDALGGLAAGLSVHAFSEMIKGTIDAGVRLTELGAKLNMGVDSLSQYKYIAEANSIELETLTGSFQKMQIAVSKAASGSGEAADALKNLGLSAADLHNLSPDEQFEKIADALSNVSNQGDKAKIAMALFGKAGGQLLPIMEDGAKGLQEMRAEADRLGVTISKTAGEQLGQFDDVMDRLGAQAQGLKNTMAIALLPALTDIGSAFESTTTETDSFQVAMEAVGSVLKGVAFAGVAVVEGISLLGKTLGAMAAEAVAIASGDFSRAAEISKENAADEDATVKKLSETYKKLFEAKQEAAKEPEQQKSTSGGGYDSVQAASVVMNQTALDEKLKQEQAYSDQISEMWNKQLAAEQAIQDERIAKSQEAAQKIYDATRTPLEQFKKDYEDLTALYQQGYFDRLGGEETYHRATLDLNNKRLSSEKKNASDSLSWEKMTNSQKVNYAASTGREILGIISGGNSEVFRQNKALALALGALDAAKAVMGAYAFGADLGGPALGAAFAAVAGLAQAKNLLAISSADYGKSAVGGGPGTYSGGSISTPIDGTTMTSSSSPQTTAAPTKVVYLSLVGNDSATFTKTQVRNMIELINEEGKDGNIRVQM